MKTKVKSTGWSRRYRAAMQKYLKQGAKDDLAPALKLGREAVSSGVDTLDVARVHHNIIAEFEDVMGEDGIIRRAGKFFAEATKPIEKTHRSALESGVRMGELNKALGRRTADLAISNRELKQGIIRRKGVESALRKSAGHHAILLKESHQLQEHLRQLTRRLLTAQEDKRKRVSRELHDEIAQTLLGINIRLLVLKNEATSNAAGLKKEIANTQRLVEKSVQMMRRLGYGFGKRHAT